MSDIPLPIANGFYKSDSLPISAQECLNLYPNIVQTEGLNKETLFGIPGLEQLTTTGASVTDVNRGSHKLGNIAYEVNGGSLFRVNLIAGTPETFTVTNLGDIAGSGRVSIADNGIQILILVPGGTGYIFTENPDTLTVISDADFTTNGNPQHVVFIDGYFLLTTDTKKFIISALNNGLAYNGNDFGTAEADPDKIVAPIVFNNQVFIGGSETFEAFSNLGGANFPFQRTGLLLPVGVFSAFSLVKIPLSFAWIGGADKESAAVWKLNGNAPEKISDTGIDTLLQRFTQAELDDSFAWSYAQKGGYFVGFSLPTTTVVYDSISKRWHERKSVILNPNGTVEVLRYRVNSLVAAYGRILVGDSQDGRIGSMDVDEFAEYGENIFARFATQPFQNNMNSFYVPIIELTMESGTGLVGEEAPRVRMARSLDGKKFGYERSRSMGKIGETEVRQIWTKNGRAKRFEVFQFTISSKTKKVIIQLTADIIGGLH